MITPILAALVIVILAARASGWLSVRLGQPAVLGELLAGLVLAPPLLRWSYRRKQASDS